MEFPVEDPHAPAVGTRLGLHAIGNLDCALYPSADPEGTAIRFESFDLWR